jgi:hypothetical protein
LSNPTRRRVAAAVLGLTVGLAGIGSTAFANRGGNPNPGPCHHGLHVGNPHCDDHDGGDDGDNGGDNGGNNGGGGDHDHGSLININLGDIDIDALQVAISNVLAVVDVDVVDVEDVSVLAEDVINVLADADIEHVTGVDLDAAIVTVLDDVASGDILNNNTAVIHAVANDVINVSEVGVAAVATVADTDVLSNDNINVLSCQSNVETGNGNLNGPGDDSAGSNNCGLLAGLGGGDLLGDDLFEGPLSILLGGDADADASVTAILGLF